MIDVLGHQHLGQQAGGGDALVDDVRRHRRLDQGFALGADPLAADVPLHGEHAGLVVQLLGHVLADALQLAATAAGGVLGFVVDLPARQALRQRLALWLLLVVLVLRRRGCLLDLGGQGGQVGVDGFFQQALLLGVEGLGLGRELQPLQDRHLVGELVDEGLLEGDLAILALDLGRLICHRAGQREHRLAQLLRVQLAEVRGVDHEA